MSPLTKVFIVLHVVLSLMLSAGMVVFVNRTENFKATITEQKQQVASAQAELKNAKADASKQAAYADAARVARDAAIADAQNEMAKSQEEITRLNGSIADASSNARIAQVAQDNLTAALNASEAQRKAISDILDSTRTDNNTLTSKVSGLNLAISDLTNKLEVSQRLLADSTETVAQLKSTNEANESRLKDAGVATNAPAGLSGGAPPINAVVRSTQPINGIPYATISVGSNEQVKAGMVFHIIDRAGGNFLGDLTIEQVDEKEATGKLEGPKISEVRAGTEVRTQL